MKDTVSLLVDSTPFEDEASRTSAVNEMVNALRSAPNITLKPFTSYSQNIAYFIEYPLYTSFPEMMITAERTDLKDHCWTALSVVNKEVTTGYTVNPTVAYMCLLIVPIRAGAFKRGNIQVIYDTAEAIVNQYIKLYKLIPYIHHHDLSERNNTRSGLLAPVLQYEITPEVRLLDGEGLLLNMGPSNLLLNQHELTPQQLNLFLSGFHKDDWSEFHNPLYRLVKAYDFNCYGDADSAIVFSSSAIEGFLMAMELVIQVREKGLDYDTALKRIKKKSLAKLISDAAKLYGLNTDTSSQRTAYGRWHKRCYKQRNNIIHKQDLYKPTQSRPAIDASAGLILHIARLVRRKYSRSSILMGVIEAIALSMLNKQQGPGSIHSTVMRRAAQIAIANSEIS